MSDLVGNPEDRFSRVEAQIIDVFDMVDSAVYVLFSFVVCAYEKDILLL